MNTKNRMTPLGTQEREFKKFDAIWDNYEAGKNLDDVGTTWHEI